MRAGVIRRGGVLRLRRLSMRLVLLGVLVPLLMLAGAAAAHATTLKVNTTADPALPSAKCSLREAVETVDSPGTKTSCGTADKFFNYIVLQAKTYQLSISPATGDSPANCVDPTGPVPDQNATGDLCINTNIGLTIVGKGPTTIIEGQPTLDDRLMTIAPQASVALVALNLEGGHAPAGAGGAVSCTLGANTDEDGGAIYNTGSLTTNVVTIQGNSAGAGSAGASGFDGCSGGSGGGIYNVESKSPEYPGSLTIQNTMLIGNVAGVGGAGGAGLGSSTGATAGAGGTGGGIFNDSGTVLMTSSSVALNKSGAGGTGGLGGTSGSGGNGGIGGAGSPGGGIYSSGGSLSVTNSTFAGNLAGSGGDGGNGSGSSGNGGTGGAGANGGALAVNDGASGLLNATIATNAAGAGGGGGTGSSGGGTGSNGAGGGVFVQSSTSADDMTLQNSIAASNSGGSCLGSSAKAIVDGGHNLTFGDTSCPAAVNGNPKLKAFADYGGYTGTLALAPGSPAINKVPAKGAHCPPTDQRGVSRPQGSACDIGAFEFATPKISIYGPRNGAKYKRGSKVLAGYVCSEGGLTDPQITPIKKCTATVTNGKPINTSSLGKKSFKVSAVDKSGNKSSKTVHYTVVR